MSREDDIDFDRDITIDPSALDVEWLDQARRMLTYGRHYADCQKAAAIAKDALKAMKAKIGRSVRANPKDYNIEKVSNDTVEEAVLLDEEYQGVARDLIDADYEAEMSKAALESLRQ